MISHPDFPKLQQQLRQGTITCHSIVTQYLDTIRRKSHLNAFLSVYDEEALQRAELIDQKIRNGNPGRLAGMVIGLKDVIAYQGHPLQASSKILDGYLSPYTATVVRKLLNEDAIIIGRQNCDEFAMGSSTENSAFGPTLNANDESRVPGGSSGGSAVAVQADMCRISIGSDTGGSVRQPASFCGIIGLKPTYSRISRHGLIAYGSSFDCIGILGKHVSDVALVLEVIAGADDFDSTVSRLPVPSYLQEMSVHAGQKYRIAYSDELDNPEGIQPEIVERLKAKMDLIRQAGHVLEPVTLPLKDYVLPTYYILATAEASANLSRFDGVRYGYRTANASDITSMFRRTRSEGFGKEVQRRILLGTFVLSARYYDAYYTQAQKVRRMIRTSIKNILKDYDFILMPVAPTTAFRLGEHTANPVEMYLSDLFSIQANVVGIPAISIPCGYDRNEMPIGMQLMTDDFEESRLLTFSDELLKMN